MATSNLTFHVSSIHYVCIHICCFCIFSTSPPPQSVRCSWFPPLWSSPPLGTTFERPSCWSLIETMATAWVINPASHTIRQIHKYVNIQRYFIIPSGGYRIRRVKYTVKWGICFLKLYWWMHKDSYNRCTCTVTETHTHTHTHSRWDVLADTHVYTSISSWTLAASPMFLTRKRGSPKTLGCPDTFIIRVLWLVGTWQAARETSNGEAGVSEYVVVHEVSPLPSCAIKSPAEDGSLEQTKFKCWGMRWAEEYKP